ncbi:MAG: hypothetical protein HOP10_14250 [Chitinophagaceae bacterium]|nr:hypothetical protein [Chitinophagaceae bacterium]
MYTEEMSTELLPVKEKTKLHKHSKQPEKIITDHTHSITMGYGECSVSGCNCRAYMGNADTCENCGHNKDLHRY